MFEAFSLRLPTGLSLDTQTLYFFADAIPHQVWIADAHGHSIFANKHWYDYTGLTVGEAKNQEWQAIFHPEDRVEIQQAWQDTLATKGDMVCEGRIKRHDGVYRWHTIRGTAQRDAKGTVWLWVGTCTDIDDQKRAERTLKTSEENFHMLAETVPQLVWASQADDSLIYCNQRYLDYLQVRFEEVQGFGWQHFLHPDDLEQILAFRSRSLKTGEPYETEKRLKEGQTDAYRWFLTRAMPMRNETGQIVKWFGTSTDIQEKKQTEKALRESEVRFRRLVESNIIGITVTDPQGTIHEANEAFLELVGYTQEDLVAEQVKWTSMTPPEYREQDAQAVEKLLTTGIFPPYEKEYIRKDGQRVPVLIGGTLFRWEGSVPWWVTLTLDLTARKEIERQKDFFLSMTGHELKTPLAALRGTLQLVQRRLRRVAPTTDHLSPEMNTFIENLTKNLADSVRHIDMQTRLINDLLDFSRIATNTLKLELSCCELGSIIRETVEDLRMTVSDRSLVLEVPEHPTVMVLADRERISQVVANYVNNALRYSSPDQPVHIGLTLQEDSASVWVRDKGPGLSEEARQKIWHRFHQVKEVPVLSGSGKGLGLGLYICQTLIAQHQGEVGVESTPGEGSTFWFTLPRVT